MTSLNRLRWTHSGHQIAVGDDDGHVFIYDVGEVSKTRRGIEELGDAQVPLDMKHNPCRTGHLLTDKNFRKCKDFSHRKIISRHMWIYFIFAVESGDINIFTLANMFAFVKCQTS